MKAITAASCCFALACSAAAHGQGQFIPLGDLPGSVFGSGSSAVSGDGRVVVGDSKVYDGFTGAQAFRWDHHSGMVNLGNLPSDYYQSQAYGVSFDGRFVVGGSSSHPGHQAFLWSEATGMIGIGDLPGRSFLSNASGVSADGRVVVGSSDSAENFDGGKQAFRWTPDGGMVGLGFLPGGRFASSFAADVSADGSVIVGKSTSSTGTQGFRWTQNEGMTPLASLPGGIPDFNLATVQDLSPNGRFAVGQDLNADFVGEAVLWTLDEDRARGLGFLPGGGGWTRASGVSNDGRVVVGMGQNAANGSKTRGFVWTPDRGVTLIEDALRADGIAVLDEGWEIGSVQAVSADGHWVTGLGVNPDGNGEAWLAYLPSIPAPTTLAPLALAGALAARRRR
jgi:probable HAF family extracellular repeat protein